LQYYAEYTKESESPDSYHLWTGLSTLASAVRRNVWLNQGTYLLYPNLYVVLIGPPGRVRKSTSIRLGRRLLYDVDGIHFGADSVTREDLIATLAKISQLAKQAALTIHSTELSSLIEPSGIKMVQFLTDIFDGDVKWRYSTKGQGKFTINNPVLNILAGTTPSWIADGLPSTVTGHGFTSRVVFVYEHERRYLRPFPKEPPAQLVRDLSLDLDHISRLEGAFTWGEGAKDRYQQIYDEIDQSTPRDYRVEGFHNRKDIYVLKVGMLLSLAENDDLIVRARDLDTAYHALNVVEESMHKSFSAVGKYEHAADYERLLATLEMDGELTSEDIYDRFHAVGDVQQIGLLISMTMATGKVDRVIEKGKPTRYRLKGHPSGASPRDSKDVLPQGED
jgi:hypothetical protein